MLPPTVNLLNFSECLLYLAAAPEVAELIKAGRLVGVSPYWNKGRWVTKGRLGDGVKKVLGVAELPVLHKDSRLAYLIMVRAHKQSHKWAKETLYQSRSMAWIWRGLSLAKKVEGDCILCRIKKKIQSDQRIGDLPCEQYEEGLPPWNRVALHLLGPTSVSIMVNIEHR